VRRPRADQDQEPGIVTARQLRRIHLTLAVVWTLLIIPTVLWWANSILWVAAASLYANSISHLAAFGGARAEESD
jgi:hypothetical protein